MTHVGSWMRLWFTFERLVSRREYVISGVVLALIKYAGDVLLLWSMTGRLWSPPDYLRPVSSLLSDELSGPRALLPTMALWALPFLWIGVSMSMRRALDAGRSAWLALLFFVPVANYVFMAVMSVLPSGARHVRPDETPRAYEQRLPGALLAIAAGAAVGLGMVAISVYALRSYGAALFLGTPFVMGSLSAFLFNRRYASTSRETQQVVFMTLAFVGGVIFLTAMEGAVCLLMAFPLAVAIAAMGGSLGRWIALYDEGAPSSAFMVIALLPVSAMLDSARPPTTLREVISVVEIDATPEVVWGNVISFPKLPEPSELVFRAGIAYPREATIVGEGVGAIRYCVFSTGAFVEPITHWEPGTHLSFDVIEQPKPLHEWSPYGDVAAPHLDDYFVSRRGEFRLYPLSGGRTRLEGSTWYEMRLYPEAYWVLFGDAIVERIHRRVLEHIKTQSTANS